MEQLFRNFVSSLVSVPQEHFYDRLILKIDDYFDTLTSNTMSGLKKKDNNRQKGIFFEQMTLQLCQHNAFTLTFPGRLKNISIDPERVWMFSDIPSDIRKEFGFTNQDNGIDLIAQNKQGKWLAIQCKYRKKPRHTHAPNGIRLRWAVTWKDLSTFYSLCARTGPNVDLSTGQRGGWFKHLVITNATSINHKGKKNTTDISICQGTLRKISKDTWLKVVGYVGQTLGSVPTRVPVIVPEIVPEGVHGNIVVRVKRRGPIRIHLNNDGSDVKKIEMKVEEEKIDQDDLRKKREAFLSRYQ